MARRSVRNLRRRTKAKAKANKKPKTKSLKRPKPKPKSTKGVRKGIASQIRQSLKAVAKKLTVIRGPKSVSSSWLESIAYVRYGNRNGVAVKFLSGAEVFYPNTTIKDYEYLRDVASKGKGIHRRFYDLPYELLN